MEALKKTMFILALISVTGYTVRHIYLKWFDHRTSILEKFDSPTTEKIKKAGSLRELETMYARIHQQVLAYDATDSIKNMEHYKKMDLEPYKQESELREAIMEWEAKSREIFQVRFYWFVGLLLTLVGGLLYKKSNRWLGLTILITGFGEMVYWTSPSFFSGGMEYENLLNNKIVLSVITLVLLIFAGFYTGTLREKTGSMS
jgi:hypothetical protein